MEVWWWSQSIHCPLLLFSRQTYNEEILPLEARDILVGALDAGGDFALVLVDGGQIQMTVACLEGLIDSLTNLAWS